MAVQIFVSYARNDNGVPPAIAHGSRRSITESEGFVTFLHKHLEFEFTKLGAPRPQLWRDTHEIEKSQQFERRIRAAIDASELFLVVLSRNWRESDWCTRELEWFAQRWGGTASGGIELRERIIVVAIHDIPPAERPALLKGQEGHRFYFDTSESGARSTEAGDLAGRERLFYEPGVEIDTGFVPAAKALASDLWRKAQEVAGGTLPPPPPPGRVVYLAKPANDMRKAYLRLVIELQNRGYSVMPQESALIPKDPSAADYVEKAMATAEVSIHLLGEKPGYEPDEDVPAIGKLQLAQASKRARAALSNGGDSGSHFRRIIWAPKAFEAERGPIDRDPLKVLEIFDPQLETDKILGEDINGFVDFVVQYLDRTAPPPVRPTIPRDAAVYIYHGDEDEEFATDLMEVLSHHNVKFGYSTTDCHSEAERQEALQAKKNLLKSCVAVMLCWAKSSEQWKNSRLEELKDWRTFERTERYTRIVIAGPPKNPYKARAQRLQQNQYDWFVDLMDPGKPMAEAIKPLIDSTQSR